MVSILSAHQWDRWLDQGKLYFACMRRGGYNGSRVAYTVGPGLGMAAEYATNKLEFEVRYFPFPRGEVSQLKQDCLMSMRQTSLALKSSIFRGGLG